MSVLSTHPLIEALGVSVEFDGSRSLSGSHLPALRAVAGVDLTIARGQVVGLVGESGSGKTTLGRTLIGLEKPADGRVRFDGKPIDDMPAGELRLLRQRMQMILQDSAASLSPRLTVRQLLEEVYDIRATPLEGRRPVEELLSMVELGLEHAIKYPHELSGGQAKRISIARALAMEPDFIVADEPTAGLDVSAVAATVNLLMRLREELGLSLLVVTHDVDVVAYMADVIAVMYLGRIVEQGPAVEIVTAPRHPYTRSLLAAVRRPGQRHYAPPIRGDIPSPRFPPPGCRFHTRCPNVRSLCSQKEPALELNEGHAVACHFWRDIARNSSAAPDIRNLKQQGEWSWKA